MVVLDDPLRWALRMVDDSFRDQIDLLRQAAMGTLQSWVPAT